MYKGWSPVEHRGTYVRPSVCPSIWLWIPPTLSGLKSAFSGLKSAFSGLISAVPRLKLAFSALKSSFRSQISLLCHEISCLGLQISPFRLQISPPKPYKAFNYPLCSNSFGLWPYFLSFTCKIIQSRTMDITDQILPLGELFLFCFLVACYTTLHPALSIRPSVGLSVSRSVTFYFFLWFYIFDLSAPAQMV